LLSQPHCCFYYKYYSNKFDKKQIVLLFIVNKYFKAADSMQDSHLDD